MRVLLVSSLLLIPLLCSCATSKEKHDYLAQTLAAPTIPEAEDCRNRVQTAFAPRYPRRALEARVQGWVVMDIELSSDGKILSRNIESESPAGVFGQAALDSIDKTVFNKADDAAKCRSLYMFSVN